MSTSHLLESFSSNQISQESRIDTSRIDSSDDAIRNLVSASSAQNYDPAQLVANYPIDPQLLQHENPNNCTENDLAPQLPLDKYRLNVDQNPHIIRRKPQEKITYLQQVAVRYLKPPPPPRAGDIVINQLPHKQVAPAPALIVRQAPPKPVTPPPVVIREAPPQPPCPIPGRSVTIPGRTVPPPARKVVVERLPPIPPKPQQVFIERWLPFPQQTQRVVYKAAEAICSIPDPKNVVIQWESPEVELRKEFKNLGVINADPQEYIKRYGGSLLSADQLPEIAHQYSKQAGVQLAAGHQAADHPLLEGDVHALKWVDLDSLGLGFYKDKLAASGNGHAASGSVSAAITGSAALSGAAHYSQHSAALSGVHHSGVHRSSVQHQSAALSGVHSAALSGVHHSGVHHSGVHQSGVHQSGVHQSAALSGVHYSTHTARSGSISASVAPDQYGEFDCNEVQNTPAPVQQQQDYGEFDCNEVQNTPAPVQQQQDYGEFDCNEVQNTPAPVQQQQDYGEFDCNEQQQAAPVQQESGEFNCNEQQLDQNELLNYSRQHGSY